MSNRAYAANAKPLLSYAQVAEAVAHDPAGVGYSSMHLAAYTGIKPLRIGNTEATPLSVNEGWYPYARVLRLYTNKAKETAAARDFVQFVQRDAGQRILEDLGFVRRFEKKLNSRVPD